MPNYALDTDEAIEASVEGTFVVERLVMGDINVRWFAKKIDWHTPYYNDSTYHNDVFNYKRRISNHYSKSFYKKQTVSGQPDRNNNLVTPYLDPYRNVTNAQSILDPPPRPKVNPWTYIRSDFFRYRPDTPMPEEPF